MSDHKHIYLCVCGQVRLVRFNIYIYIPMFLTHSLTICIHTILILCENSEH